MTSDTMPPRAANPDAWRQVLGATDMVAVAGLSPYRSPLQVWLDKRGELPEEDPTPSMQRGIMLEPVVAQMYEAEQGVTLTPISPWRHNCLAASPDRITSDKARIVEIKTHTPWVRGQYGEAGTDAVPAHIIAQVHAQVAVGRLVKHPAASGDIHHVAAFFGDEYATFVVNYDPELGRHLCETGERFWHDHVIAGIPPEPSGHRTDTEWIASQFPAPRIEEAVQADAETEALIADLRTARAATKAAETREAELINRLKLIMGDAAQLSSSAGVFTWRLASGGEMVDGKALRAQFPDVYAQVAKPRAASRRFSVPRGFDNE